MTKPIKEYISENAIKSRVGELAKEISADYTDTDLLVVGILKGSVIFFADLIRDLNVKSMEVDFMVVKSYTDGTEPGQVRILKDLDTNIEFRDVLIVEDIVDTGHTLDNLMSYLKIQGANSIKICTLLDKPSRRRVTLDADYIGFTVENEFLVGYGLDMDEHFRNLPYIGIYEG